MLSLSKYERTLQVVNGLSNPLAPTLPKHQQRSFFVRTEPVETSTAPISVRAEPVEVVVPEEFIFGTSSRIFGDLRPRLPAG
ncbi:MAG: hypothetical protein LBD67_08030 [Candidatus Accumulibacter sp.]|nr:hypothetical protein [Accumulibacter sp.]